MRLLLGLLVLLYFSFFGELTSAGLELSGWGDAEARYSGVAELLFLSCFSLGNYFLRVRGQRRDVGSALCRAAFSSRSFARPLLAAVVCGCLDIRVVHLGAFLKVADFGFKLSFAVFVGLRVLRGRED